MSDHDPQDTALNDIARAVEQLSATVLDLAVIVAGLPIAVPMDRVATVQQRAEDVQDAARAIVPQPGAARPERPGVVTEQRFASPDTDADVED